METDRDAETGGETKVEAKAARKKRRERAELEARLAGKKCPHCATVGLWAVTSVNGRVRYIQCGGCGRRDCLAVIVPEIDA